MARNSNATTVTELIYELEAINDVIGYIEIAEKHARQNYTEYLQRFADTEEEYWREEAIAMNTKADAYAECKRFLTASAIG